jgi:hypothetical protein
LWTFIRAFSFQALVLPSSIGRSVPTSHLPAQ